MPFSPESLVKEFASFQLYLLHLCQKLEESSFMGLYLEPVFAAYVFILAVVPVPHYHIMLLLCFTVTIDLQYNLHSGMALLQHGTIFFTSLVLIL